MSQGEADQLVRDLVAATREGRIRWVPAEATPDFFFLETEGGTVNIFSENHQKHPFVFRIFDSGDTQLFEQRTEIAPFYSPDEEAIAALFEAARESVYDLRGTVNAIRRSLDL